MAAGTILVPMFTLGAVITYLSPDNADPALLAKTAPSANRPKAAEKGGDNRPFLLFSESFSGFGLICYGIIY
jgi:hypothetical protein